MKKPEIIDKIVASLNGPVGKSNQQKGDGVSKKTVERVIKALEDVIVDALPTLSGVRKDKDVIALTGFCTFRVTNRKATKGRNPSTGEPIVIPARKTASITVGQRLRNALNGKSKGSKKPTSKKK